MIAQAWKRGDICPVSGNNDIGLAVFAASRGHTLMLNMLEAMHVERRDLLNACRAALDTPVVRGMGGANSKAEGLASGLGEDEVLSVQCVVVGGTRGQATNRAGGGGGGRVKGRNEDGEVDKFHRG